MDVAKDGVEYEGKTSFTSFEKKKEMIDEETGQAVPAEQLVDAAAHRADFKLTATQKDLDAFLGQDLAQVGNVGPVKDVLWHVAFSGGIAGFQWMSIQTLFWLQFKLLLGRFVESSFAIAESDGETFETRCARVEEKFFYFSTPPFTTQRMAELLCHPYRYYKTTPKFFDAFSKLVMGISNMADGGMDYGEDSIIDNTFANPYIGQTWVDLTESPPLDSNGNGNGKASSSSSSSSSAMEVVHT
jgi:hypothetical protein